MTRLDPTFSVAALGAVERALNGALALDPRTLQRLGALEGKVIGLEFQNLGFTLHVAPHAEGVRLMGFFGGVGDTTLSGNLGGFLKLAHGGEGFFGGDLAIRGDVDLGQRFQRIFAEIDLDLEEHLSHLTGDVIAHQAGNLLRGLSGWAQQATESLRQGTGDYLKEEARIVPTRPEVEAFARAVESLRSDADRLEARLKQLRRKLD